MISELLSGFHPIFAAYGALALSIYALFRWADAELSEEVRSYIGAWLYNRDHSHFKHFYAVFYNIFCSVFGERHFSKKCFLRSSLVSVICIMCIFFGVLGFFYITDVGTRRDADIIFEHKSDWFLGTATSFVLLNIACDYAGLYSTRRLIAIRSGTSIVFIVLFMVDTLLKSTMIWLSLWILASINPQLDEFLGPRGFSDYGWVFSVLMLMAFAATTFVSSIWIVLFIIGVQFTRQMVFFGRRGIPMIKKLFDTNKKPLTSLGNAVGLIMLLIGIIHSVIASAFRWALNAY